MRRVLARWQRHGGMMVVPPGTEVKPLARIARPRPFGTVAGHANRTR